MVRVRLFAALREAAGTGQVELPAGRLPVLLDALRAGRGEHFSSVLSVCTVLVDGSAVPRAADVEIPDGAELALLPPVSGGSSGLGERSGEYVPPLPAQARALPAPFSPLAATLLVAGLAGLAAGRVALAVVIVAGAALALADLAVLIDRGIARPVLPVAAVPALALPVALAIDPASGWDAVSAWFGVATLALFAFVLLSGRRRGTVTVLGTTLLAMLLVGLGASALVLLRAEPEGLQWFTMLTVLVLAADGATLLARFSGAAPQIVTAAPLLGSLLVGIALTIAPGGTPLLTLGLLMAAAAGGSAAGAGLMAELCREGRLPPRPTPLPLGIAGAGAVAGALDAFLLAAPVAFIVVTA